MQMGTSSPLQESAYSRLQQDGSPRPGWCLPYARILKVCFGSPSGKGWVFCTSSNDLVNSKWYIFRKIPGCDELPPLGRQALNAATDRGRVFAAHIFELVKKAKDYVNEKGMEKSLVEFNNSEGSFNTKSDINENGDLYICSVEANAFKQSTSRIRVFAAPTRWISSARMAFTLCAKFVKLCFGSPAGKGRGSCRWPNPVPKETKAKKRYIHCVPEPICD